MRDQVSLGGRKTWRRLLFSVDEETLSQAGGSCIDGKYIVFPGPGLGGEEYVEVGLVRCCLAMERRERKGKREKEESKRRGAVVLGRLGKGSLDGIYLRDA